MGMLASPLAAANSHEAANHRELEEIKLPVIPPYSLLRLLRTRKDGAGVIGRNGIGRSRHRNRGVVEPAEINGHIESDRDGRWTLTGRARGSEAARIDIQIELRLYAVDVRS